MSMVLLENIFKDRITGLQNIQMIIFTGESLRRCGDPHEETAGYLILNVNVLIGKTLRH